MVADFAIIIPARYASQRFPGKPLAEGGPSKKTKGLFSSREEILFSKMLFASQKA